MRVLLIDYSVGFGGATKSIGMLRHEMRGVEYTVLTCQTDEQCELWFANLNVYRFRRRFNYAALMGIRKRLAGTGAVVRLKLLAVGDLLATMAGFLKISYLILRHRIQLVHLNNGLQPLEAYWAVRFFRIACVIHLRAYPRHSRTERISRIRAQVIAVSQSVRLALLGENTEANFVSVVWDPVDLSLFDRTRERRNPVREKLGISEHEVAVGIFGRVVNWKGQLEFVRSCLQVLEAGTAIRPVIIGGVSDGPQAYLEKILELVRVSRFADCFIFTGYQEEPAPFYHAMDIVVHFSLTPEPLGMVVPEGMAAGKAVVAADAGGPAEVVAHDVDGRLVTARDTFALAEEITALAREKDERYRLGRNAEKRARQEFSIERAASATREAYDRALAETR